MTAALDAGLLVEQDGLWRLTGHPELSPRLLDLIGTRFDGLDSVSHRALELLSLGEPLELGLLDALVGADVIPNLERQRIVTTEQDGRRTIANGLRRDLAGVMSRMGARRGGDSLRLASWLLDAAPMCSQTCA